MLAYILAIAVAVGSFALYMAAFFFPEVHRKSDFIWSGVGLFYALVLWVCAGRITGGVLLGQIASVALVGWLGWETLTLRRSLTPAAQQTEIPSPEALQEKLTSLSIPQRITSLFATFKDKAQQTASKVTQGKSGTGTTQTGASKTTPAPTSTDAGKPRVTVLDNRTDEDEDETVLLNQPPVPPAPSKPESQPESQIEVISVPFEESVQDTDLDDLEPPASVEATTGETAITAPETSPASPSEDDLEPPASVEAATTGETATTAPETSPSSPSSPSELEASPENVPEPVRPNPPDPELVEAALEDAEEKHIPASPPEPAHEETSDSVSGTEQANQPLENPPNPT
ncbi:Ycf66 family protein [Coleofasciculus sp. FACHB-SPT9]|uniref:Ycf66 family protein n=1 Tax=Cyanophyceae TaxID=3028117 RepID=UPI00168329BD|nr:Ycf66 family protein [Coleofasciculus sp. FACHB-SPT9]MBD1889541.1 Ycf66 family protein [Coleofasciculus sp. FACHB-SPT9]